MCKEAIGTVISRARVLMLLLYIYSLHAFLETILLLSCGSTISVTFAAKNAFLRLVVIAILAVRKLVLLAAVQGAFKNRI